MRGSRGIEIMVWSLWLRVGGLGFEPSSGLG